MISKLPGALFSMLGHGDIHFLDDKLDFNLRLDMKGPGVLLMPMYKLFEYAGTGSLKKPDWHPSGFRAGSEENRNGEAAEWRNGRLHRFAGSPNRRLHPVLLGAHMSIRGGVSMAIERARSIHCTAMQIFVKNNMQWFARPLSRAEIRAFLDHVQRGELLSVFGHANYLINLAATNPQFHANSIRALAEELVRADQLELPFLVLHPGAHLGAGEQAGLEKIVNSIDEVFRKIPKRKNENRARDHSRPGLVHRSSIRAPRAHHG